MTSQPLYSENEWRPIVKAMFESDKAFLAQFHEKAGAGLEACLAYTMKDFADSEFHFNFYLVTKGNSTVGYFGTERCDNLHYLSALFIHPDFRSEDGKNDFMQIIYKHFNARPFFAALYENNSRARKYYLKHGAKVLDHFTHMGDQVTLFVFGDNSWAQ